MKNVPASSRCHLRTTFLNAKPKGFNAFKRWFLSLLPVFCCLFVCTPSARANGLGGIGPGNPSPLTVTVIEDNASGVVVEVTGGYGQDYSTFFGYGLSQLVTEDFPPQVSRVLGFRLTVQGTSCP